MSHKRKRKALRPKESDVPLRSPPIGSPAAFHGRPADRRLALLLSVAVLVVSCGFLFFRLGHYPLWGDEADTAIYARGIARTGDTLARIDHNLYAYHKGAVLKNLHGRYVPPACFYLAAPFVGVRGASSFWPRFPFAVCGLLSVALILYWMYRSWLTTAAWIAMSLALLGNISFFLFCRQCRYYALTILLSIAIAYLYVSWNGRWRGLLGIMLASVLLLLTHYLAYAGLYAVLACDWLLFRRRDLRLSLGRWLALFSPQLLIGIVTVWFYNPLGSEAIPAIPGRNLLLDKMTLIWWYFQDLNNCEFGVGILMLAAPLAYLWTRNVWLLRGAVAVVIYTLIVAIFSPQPVAITHVADVRYLAAQIPLCFALSALVLASLVQYRWFFALLLGTVIFGSNVFNHPFTPAQWRCRPAEYIGELCRPRKTSIDVTVQWINEHVRPRESIWVLPDYMEAALMYHAPHPVYAWHLDHPPKEQFKSLPPIHFFGRALPDYFIIFGPRRVEVERLIREIKAHGVDYQLAEILDIFWDDRTRPEIFWRSFRPMKRFNRRLQAVYVYRRTTPG